MVRTCCSESVQGVLAIRKAAWDRSVPWRASHTHHAIHHLPVRWIGAAVGIPARPIWRKEPHRPGLPRQNERSGVQNAGIIRPPHPTDPCFSASHGLWQGLSRDLKISPNSCAAMPAPLLSVLAATCPVPRKGVHNVHVSGDSSRTHWVHPSQ
jgi:hypothetical protein